MEDHFCPWVGGMVGFSRYKFFLQFVTYTAIFCSFVVASAAPVFFLSGVMAYGS
jgi:palmitoyltransferase